MAHDLTSSSEIVFTIYPNPSVIDKINYSTQFVIKSNYFPPKIQELIDNIDSADNPFAIESAIDNLTEYIGNRKRELISHFEESKLREGINQRKLMVFVNEDHVPLVEDRTGELVYIAGPMGGGVTRLNHDLQEIKPEKWQYLVTFDEKNVAMPLSSIVVRSHEKNENYEKIMIEDSNDKLDEILRKPLVLDGDAFSLITAAQYFERKYQEISSIVDFSPLLDSGMTAASALIRANMIYFENFPITLKNRLRQYKSEFLNNYDFLGIQKIVDSLDQAKIEITGFRFMDQGREFSCVLDDLFKGLKIFILSENSIFAIQNKIFELKTNTELLYEIENYHSRFSNSRSIGDISTEGRFSGILRELIGPSTIKQSLDNSDIKPIRVPIGFFKFTKGSELKLESTFGINQLPPQYFAIIENFGNALKFIEDGPLRILKYFPTESSIYLSCDKYMFEICREQPDNKYDEMMTIYYLAISEDEIQEMFDIRKQPIEQWMEYFFEPSLRLNYQMVKNRYEQHGRPQILTLDEIETAKILKFRKPVSLLAEEILSEFMVPMQLKLVLSEINDWEEGIKTNFDQSQQLLTLDETTGVGQISPDWSEKMTTENYNSEEREKLIQLKLDTLEKEMTGFNPSLYSFISNLLQREHPSEVDTRVKFHAKIKNMFQDLKVAILDFGLVPHDWVHAMEIQLWLTYQSQLNYMRHNLINILGELLGFDYTGEDIDLLENYSKINHANYSSFDGMILGDKYILYKKAYAFFRSKFKSFHKDLQGLTSLMELISRLEVSEEIAREKARANLPKLPTMKK